MDTGRCRRSSLGGAQRLRWCFLTAITIEKASELPISMSDLAPFVAATLRDKVVQDLQEENKQLRAEMAEQTQEIQKERKKGPSMRRLTGLMFALQLLAQVGGMKNALFCTAFSTLMAMTAAATLN
jgi:hypothetical protein